MEYGNNICPRNMDNGYMKHIGWGETIGTNDNFKDLWEPSTLARIQVQITQLLEGVHESGNPIIVPIDTIANVLSQCYESNVPTIGDIHSRFIITNGQQSQNEVRNIIDRTVNIITTQIRNEYEIAQNNNKLSIWSTLYGDFNKEGLRAHAPLKVRKKRPQQMMFNMRY